MGNTVPLGNCVSLGGVAAGRAAPLKEIFLADKTAGRTAHGSKIAPAFGAALRVSGHFRAAGLTEKMGALWTAFFKIKHSLNSVVKKIVLRTVGHWYIVTAKTLQISHAKAQRTQSQELKVAARVFLDTLHQRGYFLILKSHYEAIREHEG